MSDSLLLPIKKLANQYAAEFIAVRHHLHSHPELSYKEFETSKLACRNYLANANTIPLGLLIDAGEMFASFPRLPHECRTGVSAVKCQ